jgi:hypothetical protein
MDDFHDSARINDGASGFGFLCVLCFVLCLLCVSALVL